MTTGIGIRGTTICDALPAGAADAPEVIRLLAAAADSLQRIHERGRLHLLLRPADLVFNSATGIDLVEPCSSPDAEQIADAAPFAAPESARRDTVTTRSDVYALAAIGFERLTGRTPAAAADNSGVIPPVSALRRDVPSDADMVFSTALAQSPSHRYASADAFAADLRAILQGRPVSAGRSRSSVLVRRWIRKHGISSATAVIALSGCGLLVRHSILSLRTEREHAERLVQSHRSALLGALQSIDAALLGGSNPPYKDSPAVLTDSQADSLQQVATSLLEHSSEVDLPAFAGPLLCAMGQAQANARNKVLASELAHLGVSISRQWLAAAPSTQNKQLLAIALLRGARALQRTDPAIQWCRESVQLATDLCSAPSSPGPAGPSVDATRLLALSLSDLAESELRSPSVTAKDPQAAAIRDEARARFKESLDLLVGLLQDPTQASPDRASILLQAEGPLQQVRARLNEPRARELQSQLNPIARDIAAQEKDNLRSIATVAGYFEHWSIFWSARTPVCDSAAMEAAEDSAAMALRAFSAAPLDPFVADRYVRTLYRGVRAFGAIITETDDPMTEPMTRRALRAEEYLASYLRITNPVTGQVRPMWYQRIFMQTYAACIAHRLGDFKRAELIVRRSLKETQPLVDQNLLDSEAMKYRSQLATCLD